MPGIRENAAEDPHGTSFRPSTIREEPKIPSGRLSEADVKQRKEPPGLQDNALACLRRAPGHEQVRVSV